jgi:hypothetical protein
MSGPYVQSLQNAPKTVVLQNNRKRSEGMRASKSQMSSTTEKAEEASFHGQNSATT